MYIIFYYIQCLLIRGAGYSNTSAVFNVTDAPDFCKQTNEEAYNWALNIAGERTRQRFDAIGQPFVFADSISTQGGPWWYAPQRTHIDRVLFAFVCCLRSRASCALRVCLVA